MLFFAIALGPDAHRAGAFAGTWVSWLGGLTASHAVAAFATLWERPRRGGVPSGDHDRALGTRQAEQRSDSSRKALKTIDSSSEG